MRLLLLLCLSAAAPLLPTPILAATIDGVPRILDGDTVEIGAQRIRVFGIDAPETDQLCLDPTAKRTSCGLSSKDALIRFSAGRPWTCAPRDTDPYGRMVAKCSVSGEDVGRHMVRQGWALAFVRYSTDYAADEKAAQAARAGLWGGAFISPWDWRARNARTVIQGAATVPADAQKVLMAPASAAPDPACTIKGNVNQQGECIYHRPGQRFYETLKMDGSKTKRWFCSFAEAEAAGCRASKV